ncbi:thymidylate synthase [Fodinibius salsisoli]|uniref:thymidylate synthase n=1 Tax=Fodinibius salsisoli TaxID=2820877 RepID=A0ABT3PSL0_9BACT|nr:thymidylate synthase [Fodinibius salsisoli]MCW9708849.1 thymidylate synthase [Fodinibius salsisoli]
MKYNNIFKGGSANEVWVNTYAELSKKTEDPQSSRIGPTQEILHAFISISNPRQRWICARIPAINPAFAIAEIIWILNGRNDSKFLNYWNGKLPEYAGKGDEYHGAYGYRLRKSFGLDQLNKAYLALKNNPNSRQVVLQIWDPNQDLPNEDGSAVSKDIPCNIVAMLKVREGKLEWQQIMRSNDIILGMPYNFIQFTTLQEIISGWLRIEVGTYNHLSDSLHLYLNDISDYGSKSSIKVSANEDDLRLPKKRSEKVVKEFAVKIEQIINDPFLSTKKLREIARWEGAPKAYKNLLKIICAEEARRSGFSTLVEEFMAYCKNPILSQYWSLWMKRFK